MVSTSWKSFSAAASFFDFSHFYFTLSNTIYFNPFFSGFMRFLLTWLYVPLSSPTQATLTTVPSCFLLTEGWVQGRRKRRTQLPPLQWSVQKVCLSSTLERIYLRTLCVHVRVIQRVTCGVADRRRRLLGCGRVRGVGRAWQCVAGWVRAGVEAEIGKFGITAISDVVVAEVFQVNKPLRPEPAADALAVHCQVNQLSWDEEGAQWDKNIISMVFVLKKKISHPMTFLTPFFLIFIF